MAGGERSHRAELGEQVEAVLDAARVGRGEERECGDVAEAQRDHLQDDRGEVRAQHLRLGVLGPAGEVLLRIEADGDTVAGAAASARALVRGGLRDGLDRQPLHLRAHAVPADPGGPGVDDVADARHGQAGLRHVRRQHDAASHAGDLRRLEHLVLVGGGEPPVQRQDLGGAGAPRGGVLALQGVRGVPNLGLTAEEDQNVAAGLPFELIERGGDSLDVVPVHRGRGIRRVVVVAVHHLDDQRPVADLHRVGAPGDLDDRGRRAVGRGEMLGEALRVDRRGGDDELEVGALRQQLTQVAEQEVDVEAALVRLVDDDRVVLPQQTVAVHLVEQDAVGHQLDAGVRADLVGEPHLVADRLADFLSEFLGDAFSDRARGETAGLRVADVLPAQLEADLRQLGGLAGTRRAGDDDHLVVTDGARDILPALADRKLGWEGDFDGDHEPSIV